MAYRKVKQIFIKFLARISSDQGPFLSVNDQGQIFINQRILILVTNGSTGLMKVAILLACATPFYFCKGRHVRPLRS